MAQAKTAVEAQEDEFVATLLGKLFEDVHGIVPLGTIPLSLSWVAFCDHGSVLPFKSAPVEGFTPVDGKGRVEMQRTFGVVSAGTPLGLAGQCQECGRVLWAAMDSTKEVETS